MFACRRKTGAVSQTRTAIRVRNVNPIEPSPHRAWQSTTTKVLSGFYRVDQVAPCLERALSLHSISLDLQNRLSLKASRFEMAEAPAPSEKHTTDRTQAGELLDGYGECAVDYQVGA